MLLLFKPVSLATAMCGTLDGVESVLDTLHQELALVMRQCGTAALDQIGRDTITT